MDEVYPLTTTRDHFLARTAVRWRAAKAKNRGWSEQEQELAAFVLDEVLAELDRKVQAILNKQPPCEEDNDA